MNNKQYCSIAEYCGKVVDCRYLSLGFEFYMLSREEIIALVYETTTWIMNFLGNKFIVKWSSDRRGLSVEHALASLKNSLYSGMGWSLTQEAYAISSVVNNQKTMNAYNRRVRYESPPVTLVSEDYPVFWNELFQDGKENPEQIKKKILHIFRETGRKMMAKCPVPDMQALFFTAPYKENIMNYHGRFVLDISVVCLDTNLKNVSIALSSLAKGLSKKYVNMNARVQLQPAGENHYIKYFGGYSMLDGSHKKAGCSENEWYKTYYIPSVEWFNIISPLAQTHLLEMENQYISAQSADIISMEQGGLVVKSVKSIEDYDVLDALALKRIVAPSLYPGMRRMSLKGLFEDDPTKFWFDVLPRSNWAIIPVLEEEVNIVGSELIFRSKHPRYDEGIALCPNADV